MPHKDPEARRAYLAQYNVANRDRLRDWQREWQRTHAEQLRAYRKKYHAARLEHDLDGVRAEQRAAWLFHRYRLTPAEFDALVTAQNNRCAICDEQPADGKALHIDHDHASGMVRGLLCGHCNRAIGLLREDPNLLVRAAEYLRCSKV